MKAIILHDLANRGGGRQCRSPCCLAGLGGFAHVPAPTCAAVDTAGVARRSARAERSALWFVGSLGGRVAGRGFAVYLLGVQPLAPHPASLTTVQVRSEMGMVSFLFWLELAMVPILLPWAFFNGEIRWVRETTHLHAYLISL